MDNYELMNRRKSFKKASKGMLLMQGAYVAEATLLLNA